MLWGINQGGTYKDIREWHMDEIAKLDLPGYAIGGLAVGESAEEMYDIIDAVEPHMPKDKPRYLMGVGTPINILEAVDRGVDFFDCVITSRNARHANLFTDKGVLNLNNQKFARDDKPLQEGCNCPTCRNYSRSYIRHLFKAKEMLGMRLCVLHNLYFYNNLMQEIRDNLDGGTFKEYKEEKVKAFSGRV
jgi:queuine tRNA-ribosyltransferase